MGRRSTSTSAFGVSRRESHDASAFYGRFTPPALSTEASVAHDRALDKLIVGDARHMDEVPDSSVALVVTSPPYFAGKEYEESLGERGVPATYLEYLDLLRDVFDECVRKLEPGGRIAVNVANLGRRPYRSLSADVIGILQDDLRLLLRGEIIWLKQRGLDGFVRVGELSATGQPGPAGPHRAGDRGQQGAIRPGSTGEGPRPHRPPVGSVDDSRRLHGEHARRLGDPRRKCHESWSSGAIPDRASGPPDRALHLP